MFPVIETPRAGIDADEIFRYISEENLPIAFNFLENLEETYELISSHPYLAPSLKKYEDFPPELRYFPVKEFPNHIIYYSVENNQILIVRIAHKARNPNTVLDI